MVITTKHVDWVGARRNCALEPVALALMKRVKDDVDRASRPYADGCGFQVLGDSDRFFVAREREPRHGAVTFCRDMKANCVRITREGRAELVVTWEWKAETLECGILLDGKPTELWKISQTALCDLFFPTD